MELCSPTAKVFSKFSPYPVGCIIVTLLVEMVFLFEQTYTHTNGIWLEYLCERLCGGGLAFSQARKSSITLY